VGRQEAEEGRLNGVFRINASREALADVLARESNQAAGVAIDELPSYPWWHATRAELLHRTGRAAAARAAYERALDCGLNEPQASHLRRRLAALS